MTKPRIKRIGVCTSGGDCAGLNAAIRSIVCRGDYYGFEIIGLLNGSESLIERPVRRIPLTRDVCTSNWISIGGTFLGSTRRSAVPVFNLDGTINDNGRLFIEGYHILKLDALISIGGDGSMDIMGRLTQEGGIPFVGIPKTIDNDLGCTEFSIGYQTALEVVVEAIDRLHTTASSHGRVMIVEVMGRDAGHIALESGIAGGADIILIPEIPYDLTHVYEAILSLKSTGQKGIIIVVSESVKTPRGDAILLSESEQGKLPLYGGIGHYLGQCIQAHTHIETRVSVLGHTQRGGSPCVQDRIMASSFGVHAVDLVHARQFGRLVIWKDRGVFDVPLQDSIQSYRGVSLDSALLQVARSLGIYVGEANTSY